MRCKFVCWEVSQNSNCWTYKFGPVYGSEENKKYWEATPAGSFQISVRQKQSFEVGKEYFIDINSAAAPE